MIEKKRHSNTTWLLAMLGIILCWGMSPLLGAVAGESFSPVFVVAVACLAGAGTLFLLTACSGRLHYFRRYSAKDYLLMTVFSVSLLAPYLFIVYQAYAKANPATALVLNYLWVVWLALLGRIILREKIGLVGALGIFISLVGIIILAQSKGSLAFKTDEAPYYIALALGTILWAAFSIGMKILAARFEQGSAMTVFLGTAGAALLAASFLLGKARMPTFTTAVPLVMIGVLPLGIAYRLWFWALDAGPVAIAGNIILLAPFAALVFLRIFRGGVIIPLHWVALAVVIGGLLLARYGMSRHRSHEKRRVGPDIAEPG